MTNEIVFPRYRWFVLIALLIATISTTLVFMALSPLMGVIAKEFNANLGTTTAMLMSTFPLCVGISCIIGGMLIDRFGFIRIAIVCMLLLVVGTMLTPVLGHALNSTMIVRIIQGIASGPILVVISPAAALWFPRSERAIVSGFQGASVSIGMALAFGLAPQIYQSLGSWQNMEALISIGPIIGLLLVIAVAFGPKPPVARPPKDPSHLSDFKLALHQPVTWIGVAIIIGGSWLLQAFNDLTPSYLAIDPPVGVGYGVSKAGMIMGIFSLTFLLFAGISGFIMKKVFKNNARPFLIIAFLFAAIFCPSLMFHFVYSDMPVLISFLILASVSSAITPCAVAFITLCYPPYITGRIEGLWQGIGIFGGAIGVLVGSLALRSTGNYQLSLIVLGIVGVVGIILSSFIKPTKVFCVNEKGIVVKAPGVD